MPGPPRPGDGALARSLAARLSPVTVATGLLSTTVFPAAYPAFEVRALHGTAMASAQHVAGEFRMLAAENPARWKLRGDRHQRLLRHERLQRVERVRFLDEGGQPIRASEYRAEAPSPWWARMQKPFTRSALARALRALLDGG